MDILYTTWATSTGGRNGHVKNEDGQIDMELRTPGAKNDRKAGTTPEDLFAAGYAACFNGALEGAMRMKRMTGVGGPTVKVEISLAKTPEGEYQLSARIGAHIPHVDQKEGLELMEQAHRICPYSRATHGNIHSELYILE